MTQSLFIAFIAIALPSILIIFTSLLSSRSTQTRENSSPFECGFDPNNNARLPFSMRFFILAVIFLVFDIEIALLLPWPAASILSHPALLSTNTLTFLLILLVGLIHEWNEGSLEWSN